jgi:NNP family nitrate/nitrite transporter-like MFS transporter
VRPIGGWISDKVGGSIVTQIISAVMVVASVAVGYVMMQAYASATPETVFPAVPGPVHRCCSSPPASATARPSARSA